MRDRRARGFVLPAAIFLLVVLGGLASWLIQLSVSTQAQDALAIEGERAYRAAEAGLEAGVYAALAGSCAGQTLTYPGTLARFTATISCSASSADEGGRTVTLYEITSTACNEPASGACPNTSPTSAEYAERRVRAVVEG